MLASGMDRAQQNDVFGVFLTVRSRLAGLIYSRVRDYSITADLVQDTFLRLWERKSALRNVSDLAGYFLITGRNIASDHARRSRLAPVIADISQLEHIADPYPSAEQFVVGQQELARLQRVIDAMPPRARQVFVLSRIEGLTYVEIGNQLGISPKTVFSHMVVALERLQAGMQTS